MYTFNTFDKPLPGFYLLRLFNLPAESIQKRYADSLCSWPLIKNDSTTNLFRKLHFYEYSSFYVGWDQGVEIYRTPMRRSACSSNRPSNDVLLGIIRLRI